MLIGSLNIILKGIETKSEERRKEEERREVEERARRLIEKENKALRKRKRNRHWFTNSKNSPKNFVKKINKV